MNRMQDLQDIEAEQREIELAKQAEIEQARREEQRRKEEEAKAAQAAQDATRRGAMAYLRS